MHTRDVVLYCGFKLDELFSLWADSLDAIGEVGIARRFAFGGKRNRPLFDIRGVIQAGAAGSGLEHFFEQLLRLRKMMVTRSGETLAAKRLRHMPPWQRALQEELEEGELLRVNGKKRLHLARS